MSKIVVAANSMITSASLIEPVYQGQYGVLFFMFNKKYKWSISKSNRETILNFYPDESPSLEDLSNITESYEWEEVNAVRYSSADLGGREVDQTFEELYMVVKEKLFGVDKVLDDIIDSSSL